MNKFFAVLIFAAFAIASCQTPAREKGVNTNAESRFVVVEKNYSWQVVYDKETMVMYAVSDGGSGYNYGNFTLLVDADGKPLLWKGGNND